MKNIVKSERVANITKPNDEHSQRVDVVGQRKKYHTSVIESSKERILKHTRDSWRIGNVTIHNRCLLAPMAGFGDRAFREICRQSGAGLSYTEMISCKGLNYRNEQTTGMVATQYENPVAVQLFGKVPSDFRAAVSDIRLSAFDIIDINMGCPVNKVIRHGEGSGLMATPQLAAEIVESCVQAAKGRPVTVKFRLGLAIGDNISVEFAKLLQEAGASALTVHGRYQQQLYKGKSDWQAIGNVADSVDIPVIGSGDIVDKEGFDYALSNYNVAAIMIGRGALGNPILFDSIVNDATYQPQALRQKIMSLCKQHFDLLTEYNPKYAVSTFKKHLSSYIAAVKGGASIRDRAYQLSSIENTFELIEELRISSQDLHIRERGSC